MADSVKVTLNGIDELKKALAALPGKLRRKVLVKALRAGAKEVQKAARVAVPVLSAPSPYRTKGLLKRKIGVRVSKESRRAGDVGVFINVKPAASGQRGANSKLDPYYWRFVEFGTKKMTARPFMQPAADALPAALAAFEREAVPAIEALNTRGA